MTELDKKFNFKEVDAKWSKYWEEENVFHADADSGKPSYTIVIPPPNVTGILHMGHALNNTLQDIIMRYKRMNGFEALWMVGTDHAGIATQNVVEKQLAKEGKKRQDLGREAFLERLWDWKKEYGDTIEHQLKKLGISCDWPRMRFTMDNEYSQAVRHTFVKLYEKGLIYQGKYIINWCPRCLTALSDEEAEHRDTQGNLYHLRYSFKDDPNKYVIVATTRPETMLGDTAVAVNPQDERYKDLIGKTLILPLVNREIKIIADDFVDPKFGTGAVKVTPAHDPNDFAMGQHHDLEVINIMQPNAILNEHAGDFEGQDRFEAREAIIDAMKELKLLEKVEPHSHAVGHCYRCHTVVEPYLSKQWFVKMEPLAKPAIEAVTSGKIKFYPERWTKVYFNWMENIRDWCISRQIWWGHRIPVWYCVGDDHCKLECKNPIVAIENPKECPYCGSINLRQDEDVLDTWFSSWLWPFATLGWPQNNEEVKKDLAHFYPTKALFTGPDIIFFWVARMIMAGLEFTDQIPFSDVYLHGTVRDAQGRKMSKSLGNALDPLEIIEEYGADALRFSLIMNSGQDLFISKDKFEIGRNFANKMWNASRLILMNIEDVNSINIQQENLDLPSQWIVSHFHTTLDKVEKAIEQYRYSEAENLIYEFFWGNFCDWYLEIIKNKWGDKNIQAVVLNILTNSLKMMHPFMPFVTEEIWQKIYPNKEALCIQTWPQTETKYANNTVTEEMDLIIDLITTVRNLRAQWKLKPNETITCHMVSSEKIQRNILKTNENLIKNLVRIEHLVIEEKLSQTTNIAASVVKNMKCAILLEDLIDIDQEKKKIKGQIEEQKKAFLNLTNRLGNKKFLERAPEDIVAKEKERLQSLEKKIKELEDVISSLG
ncbi:Valyl-tRNA synthetase [hydrothermal vent metagenome]|uniref:valine--tRNA ligase n=1 Tax=hydrothermal vent metagenome TaxID=652676 RepID=A0A3B1DV23_9ZZZZ